MVPALYSCYLYIAIFAIEKAKITKDILDQKTCSAGTAVAGITTFALQFLKVKKQKQYFNTLTQFYVYIALYIFVEKINTCNRLSVKYISDFIF